MRSIRLISFPSIHVQLRTTASGQAMGGHIGEYRILGLGELGQACAANLLSFGFKIHGWSRTEKTATALSVFSVQNSLMTCSANAIYWFAFYPSQTKLRVFCANRCSTNFPGTPVSLMPVAASFRWSRIFYCHWKTTNLAVSLSMCSKPNHCNKTARFGLIRK